MSENSSSSNSTSSDATSRIADQGLAAWIAKLNQERRIPLFEALDALEADLSAQDQAFTGALSELDWVRNKIGAPEHILGNPLTKHGEIAEMAEVGIQRARAIMDDRAPDAFWNAADRLGAEDYGIAGVGVQSKFINGVNNGLRHVLEHAERYPEFGLEDGAYYHIPKDHHESIQRILAGEAGDFHSRTIAAVKDNVQRLEEAKGRSFDDLVRPASHDYAAVQQGKISDTLDQHESELSADNEAAKEDVLNEHRDDIEAAQEEAAPTLSEAGQVVAAGAAVGAGLQSTIVIFQKWSHDGRLPNQFSREDWKEIGGSAFSGGVSGGISAGALYGITNYSALSAPLAGAVVSSGRAMVTLNQQYRSGAISLDEFVDLSIVSSTEAGITAAGAALGQATIPVPILGALIGSVTAQLVSSHAKSMLEDQQDAFLDRLDAQHEVQRASLNEEHRALLAQFEAEMTRLGDLTSTAFDLDMNAHLLMAASIQLAQAHSVPDEEIMRTNDDVDAFILGLDHAEETGSQNDSQQMWKTNKHQ